MGRRTAALSRIAALANGVGGPTGGYGVASAAVAGALAPSSTVRFLSVTAAISLLLAAMGGPVGWLVAGVASLIAALAGYSHATTWRERVIAHVVDGINSQVASSVEDSLEETVRTFFSGLVLDIEERTGAFLAQLSEIVGDIERELDRERRSREEEVVRLSRHLKDLDALRGELREFLDKMPPLPAPGGPSTSEPTKELTT
jgi:hypothetical protein